MIINRIIVHAQGCVDLGPSRISEVKINAQIYVRPITSPSNWAKSWHSCYPWPKCVMTLAQCKTSDVKVALFMYTWSIFIALFICICRAIIRFNDTKIRIITLNHFSVSIIILIDIINSNYWYQWIGELLTFINRNWWHPTIRKVILYINKSKILIPLNLFRISILYW